MDFDIKHWEIIDCNNGEVIGETWEDPKMTSDDVYDKVTNEYGYPHNIEVRVVNDEE